jgi:hypothetical protein
MFDQNLVLNVCFFRTVGVRTAGLALWTNQTETSGNTWRVHDDWVDKLRSEEPCNARAPTAAGRTGIGSCDLSCPFGTCLVVRAPAVCGTGEPSAAKGEPST